MRIVRLAQIHIRAIEPVGAERRRTYRYCASEVGEDTAEAVAAIIREFCEVNGYDYRGRIDALRDADGKLAAAGLRLFTCGPDDGTRDGIFAHAKVGPALDDGTTYYPLAEAAMASQSELATMFGPLP